MRSMASLMSVCTTVPVRPTFFEKASEVARAPGNVEHAVAFLQVGHHHRVGLPGRGAGPWT